MEYRASHFAVIPVDADQGVAGPGIAAEKRWIPRSTASGGPGTGFSRKLLLPLLGSLFLIAGQQAAQASIFKDKSLFHHHVFVKHSLLQCFPSGGGCFSHSPIIFVEAGMRKPECGSRNAENEHSVLMCASIPTSHLSSFFNQASFPPVFVPQPGKLPASDFPLPTSHGALLAHQTTSISSPFPTARNGAAVSIPLPEAGESNHLINSFQICTLGYRALPGIPKPASGLFLRPGGLVHTYTCEGAPETDHIVHPLNPPPAGDISSDSEMRFPPLAGARGGEAKNKIFSPIHPPNTSTPQSHEQHQTNQATYFFQYQYKRLYET